MFSTYRRQLLALPSRLGNALLGHEVLKVSPKDWYPIPSVLSRQRTTVKMEGRDNLLLWHSHSTKLPLPYSLTSETVHMINKAVCARWILKRLGTFIKPRITCECFQSIGYPNEKNGDERIVARHLDFKSTYWSRDIERHKQYPSIKRKYPESKQMRIIKEQIKPSHWFTCFFLSPGRIR